MPAPKKKPDEVGIYISPDVLRLQPQPGHKPYSMDARAVLSEVLAFHQMGNRCSASDQHFAKRFTISKNTASRAVQRLVADGLLSVEYDTTSRLTRYLTPTLDHPQNGAGHHPQNGAGSDGDHPQNGARTTPNLGHAPTPNWGTKNTVKLTKKTTHKSAASRRVGGASFQSGNGEHDAGRKGAAPDGSTTPPQSKVAAGTAGSPTPKNDDHARACFADFWEAWPTKQRRKDAAAAFGQLTADDQQQAAERAARWLAQHPRQVERGAVPFPAKWLEGEQWNDGPEPKDRSPKPGQPPAPPTHARTTRRLNTDDLK